MSEAQARVRVVYADPTQATKAFGAVHPDDDEHCTTRLEGATVIAELRGPESRSLLRAVDDLLACLGVAEDVMNGPPMEPRNA